MGMPLLTFERKFGTDDRCLHYVFTARFGAVRCPKCGRANAYHRHKAKQCYTCSCGRSHIYPKKGTLFESSHVPLSLWFRAIFLIARQPAVTSKEVERRTGVTYPTAWRMTRKIRDRMRGRKNISFEALLMRCTKARRTEG